MRLLQVLVDMVWEGLMFNDQNTDSLFEWGAFQSKYVSKIEEWVYPVCKTS
jgi:hexokinase